MVGFSRAVRYSFIAILADHYGCQVIPVLRQPAQLCNWLLLIAATVAGLVILGILIDKRPGTPASAD